MSYTAAVITVSDPGSRGLRQDTSGPAAPAPLTVVEGTYACHPALWDCYDLRAFLTVDLDEQLCRIKSRSGPEKAAMFRTRWIPLEEQYFAAFSIPRRCDIILHSETEVQHER